jgi:hypothetical protein
MPGSQQCARCGASLALANSDMNVHPPRAGSLVQRVPHWWALWRGSHAIRDWISSGLKRVAGEAQPTHFDMATLFRCLLPGWPQWHRGSRERASLLTACFLFFLGTGLLFTGRVLGSFLLGITFSIHVASTADALVVHYASWRDRVGFTLLASLAIFFVVYFPTAWVITRFATPFQVSGPMRPFTVGDVLWCNRWNQAEVDDWVLYEVPSFSVNGRTERGQAAQFRIEGQRINCIVAKSGDSVDWDGNQLSVNGKPSRWQLNKSGPLPRTMSWVIPKDLWLIIPNNLLPPGIHLSQSNWRRAAQIPSSQVQGKVFFQSLPLNKMGPLAHTND